MSKLILYGTVGSPPVRSVVLTLHALELEYEFRIVDMKAGENRTEEYLKKNPQHTVPLLEDNGHYVWDSHAIITYLARKYGKTDALYPKDFFQRAVVDQRLHFESGVMAPAGHVFTSPNASKEEKFAAIFEVYNFLEAFLTNTYIAGDHLTIGDFSILPPVNTMNILVPIESEKTPKLVAWLGLLQQLPYYNETEAKGLGAVAEVIKGMAAEGKL